MSAASKLNNHAGKLHQNSRVLLSDGHEMPVIALGTFSPEIVSAELTKHDSPKVTSTATLDPTMTGHVEQATKIALDIGYRHVDCADLYRTEHIIGKVFQEKFSDGTLKREDLFYTTKLWSSFHQPHLVRPALERSLHSLQLDYVDLYIIHLPISLKAGDEILPVDEKGAPIFDCVDLCQTWEALEKCKDDGLVKSIGVSNFSCKQLDMILNKPGLKYKPVCNQVECHPYLNQSVLLEFCKSKDIVLTAYGVLGSSEAGSWVDNSIPKLLENPVLISIGKKYQKTPAQVSIRFTLQRGIVPIVKSFNPERLRQNFEVFDFQLSQEDMKAIDGLNQNLRYWKFPM
ncbi:prostaglandin F synthase 1-like [Dendropsophus ebraccatus]|uniref:prostaglandin F synthase 1-like n=1 Tax=Dendropsophus ebraccatus TaxID=150705 RepID=UPI003831570C